MAKKVSDDEAQTNTIDPTRLKKIIADIEGKIEAKLSHKMEYVANCKPFNEAVSNAYEMGAAFVPKKVLKAKIKERELRRRIDGIADDLEDDQKETFEQLSQALGELADLPLGKGAATFDRKDSEAAAKPKSRRAPAPPVGASADDEDLRSTAQKQRDADRAAQANADALEAGIKPLDAAAGSQKGLPDADGSSTYSIQ